MNPWHVRDRWLREIACADLSHDAANVNQSHAEFRAASIHLCHGPGRCGDLWRRSRLPKYKAEAGNGLYAEDRTHGGGSAWNFSRLDRGSRLGQSFSSKEMIASLLTYCEVLHSPQFFASFFTGNVSLPLASFIFLPLNATCWPSRSAAESPDKA
jgi:hypothetical protein